MYLKDTSSEKDGLFVILGIMCPNWQRLESCSSEIVCFSMFNSLNILEPLAAASNC